MKEKAALFPSPVMKGFRNIAVHEYQYVDAEKGYQKCTIHIMHLRDNLKFFVRDSVKSNLLSGFELQLSKGFEFYSPVRLNKLED